MTYKYKMIQVPQAIEVKQREHRGNEAAVYLQSVVDSEVREGWEFYRVDSIGVQVKPGCLAGLLGQAIQYSTYHVITFRQAA